MAEYGQGTPRRSSRVRKPTVKATDNEYVKRLSRSGFVEILSSSSEDEELLRIQQELRTPSLLQNTEHVQGDKMFSFQSRKTKKNLIQKVKEVQESQSTPKAERSKMQKAIRNALNESESDEDPFVDSGSDYVATASGSSSSDEEISQKSEVESDEESPVKINRNPRRTTSNRVSTMKIEKVSGHQHRKTKNYLMKTDDYFSNQASNKIVTSNHTLDKLETPRLGQDQVQKLIRSMKLTETHQQCLKQLNEQNKKMFMKWLFLLHENFNILLYGLGSKKTIIEEFCNDFLQDSPVIVVNGFFPSLSIKDILDNIIDLLELKKNPANVYECCSIIEQEFSYMLDTHLYLIVHNIDGEMLRNSKAQNVLAHLASIENIHLIASIDHINGPLIWDHSKLGKFNYTWWDMTTFLPYIDETSFEGSMMIQKSGEFALSSLRNVFLSLTTNSKGIYLMIMKYQLDNEKNQQYQGMAFKDLYASCRQAFLVSSDLALRAQLTEFVDHKMVKFKRSVDGVEYLVIPISNNLLKKFLDEQDN